MAAMAVAELKKAFWQLRDLGRQQERFIAEEGRAIVIPLPLPLL